MNPQAQILPLKNREKEQGEAGTGAFGSQIWSLHPLQLQEGVQELGAVTHSWGWAAAKQKHCRVTVVETSVYNPH